MVPLAIHHAGDACKGRVVKIAGTLTDFDRDFSVSDDKDIPEIPKIAGRPFRDDVFTRSGRAHVHFHRKIARAEVAQRGIDVHEVVHAVEVEGLGRAGWGDCSGGCADAACCIGDRDRISSIGRSGKIGDDRILIRRAEVVGARPIVACAVASIQAEAASRTNIAAVASSWKEGRTCIDGYRCRGCAACVVCNCCDVGPGSKV